MHVPNEKFHKAVAQGRPNFFMSPTNQLGYKDAMPPGVPYWAMKMGMPLHMPKVTPIKYDQPPFELRPEQVPIFEAAKNIRAGLIEMTTGGGKSVIAAAMVHSWSSSTLILVHNMDMVQQFYEAFDKFLGWKIGRLNSHHKDIKPITVTTFNSARDRQDELFEKGFKNLIVDEADLFFTPKGQKFVSMFPGERVFAFTATIRTKPDEFMKKGEVPALERFYGYKMTGHAAKNVLGGIFYDYYKREPYKDEFNLLVKPQLNWTEFRKCLDTDMARKTRMMNYIMENHTDGDRTLVLFDRVADVEGFHFSCKLKRKFIIHGKIKKTARADAKKEFLSEGGILFAQYQTSSRGVDYPECNKVFLLFPIKSETTLRQAVGRAIRFLPDKVAYVYDFAEELIYYQWRARKRAYKKHFKNIPIKPIKDD